MTAAQVARIEKGERSVRAVEAAVLADLYGLSVDALLGKRARPKADLLDTLLTTMETLEHTLGSLRSLERTLREATETLADADTDGLHAKLVGECESACNALTGAVQVVGMVSATNQIYPHATWLRQRLDGQEPT